MKILNSQFSILNLTLLSLLAAPASGADYFIYRDAAGKLILSNVAASDKPLGRSPRELVIEKYFNLRDSTDAEIAATAAENRRTEARLFAREVLDVEREAVKATAALAEEIKKTREGLGVRGEAIQIQSVGGISRAKHAKGAKGKVAR